MIFGDLLANIGGIADFFAPFIGVLEAILNVFNELFGSLGGLGG